MSTVDSFPSPKRTFYERTRTKLVASLILGGITCFLLGFASAAGGQSMSAVCFMISNENLIQIIFIF